MGSPLIWVEATKQIKAETVSGARIFQPGETFQANSEKAKYLIEKGILKLVTIGGRLERERNEIHRFWIAEILPHLSALSLEKRLPNLTTCPLWKKAETLWQTLSIDSTDPAPIEQIKDALRKAIYQYEKSDQRELHL